MENKDIKTINIHIDEWLKLTQSGVYTVARVTPTGNSMWPLIRSCRDQIEVKPANRELMLGDVVVFKRADGRSVVHRVYKISEDGQRVQTFGDNCIYPDAPVKREDVFGLATKVFRGKRVIDLDCEKAREAINVYPKYAGVRRVVYGARGTAARHADLILWVLLGIYALGVLYLTFLCRTSGTEMRYNLEPLWEIKKLLEDGDKAFGTYIRQNIMLFIPIGFLACAAAGETKVARKRAEACVKKATPGQEADTSSSTMKNCGETSDKGAVSGQSVDMSSALKALAIGIGWSLIIEFSQLLFKRGLFETDDILNNTIGTAIGILAAVLLVRFVKSRKARLIITVICALLAIATAVWAKFKYGV